MLKFRPLNIGVFSLQVIFSLVQRDFVLKAVVDRRLNAAPRRSTGMGFHPAG